MTFLIDAQLPPQLAQWLNQQGHLAEHVFELRLHPAEDATIWDHAVATGAIIITKDEDFAERTARTNVGPIIVWLRIGNATNRALMEWLTPRWAEIVELLESGDRLVEVR